MRKKTLIRELKTDCSFTQEAKELFKELTDNQNAIIDKQNELEELLRQNTELLVNSKAFSNYLTIAAEIKPPPIEE